MTARRSGPDSTGRCIADQDHLAGNALDRVISRSVSGLTSVERMCAGGGSSRPLAAVRLSTKAPGMVLRRPSCGEVLPCAADQGDRRILTADGVRHPVIDTP